MSLGGDMLRAVVREAVDLEINGKRFYERAAAATRNKAGRRMFRKLASEEDGHLEAIGEIVSAITGNGDWRRLAAEEIARGAPSPIIDQLEAAIVAHGGSEAMVDEAEALRLAMDLERRAVRLFEGLADRARDPQVKALALKLADEERFHYDLLQAQADSLLNVGIWLDQAEFRMDGKF